MVHCGAIMCLNTNLCRALVLAAASVAVARLAGEAPTPAPAKRPQAPKCDTDQEVDPDSIPELQTFECPVGFVQKAGTRGCAGGAFKYCMVARKRLETPTARKDHQNIHSLLIVPAGTKDFRVNISASGDDVDLYVVDKESGAYLVHATRGILHGVALIFEETKGYRLSPPKLETVYKNMTIKYSGDDRYSPVDEYVIVEGTATTTLDLQVSNWGVDNDAIVNFEYMDHGTTSCQQNLTIGTACVALDRVPAHTQAPTAGPTLASPHVLMETYDEEDWEYVLQEKSAGSCHPTEPGGLLSTAEAQCLVHCKKECDAIPGCSYISYDEELGICVTTSVCDKIQSEEGHGFKIYHKEALISKAYEKLVLDSGEGTRGNGARGGTESMGRTEAGSGTGNASRVEGSAKETGVASLFCDAPVGELLYSGPSEGEEDCEDKCTLASECVFFSISDTTRCVLTSTCDKVKVDSKGATYCVFAQKGAGRSMMWLWAVLSALLLLCCLLVLVLDQYHLFLYHRKKSDYQPVNYASITRQIQEEMGGVPVAFEDHDYHLKAEGEQAVKRVAMTLAKHATEEVCVKVLGYTGEPAAKWHTHELCETLGYKRALRIADTLEKEGCTHRIIPIGYGHVMGKGATCEIHACTSTEAAILQREARSKGQFPDMATL